MFINRKFINLDLMVGTFNRSVVEPLNNNDKQGEENMKKFAAVALIALMAFSFAACAKSAPEQIKVKCPACGYEFTTPFEGN